MPAGGKKEKVSANELVSMKPTAEEVEEARKLLFGAAEKKRRSKMACMVNWLKGRDGDDRKAREMLESRGEARQEYLLQWLAWSAKEKKKKCELNRHVTSSKENFGRTGWKSFDQAKDIIGDKRLDVYIEKKLIQARPDPKTGSDEKEMQDYWIEESWTDKRTGESFAATTATESDDFAEHMTLMDGMLAAGSSPSKVKALGHASPSKSIVKVEKEGGAEPEKKKEEKKPEHPLRKQLITLLASRKETHKEFAHMCFELETMKHSAEGQKYQEEFISDCTAELARARKVTNVFNSLATGGNVDQNLLIKMIPSLEKLRIKHRELLEHGTKFNFIKRSAKQAKRKI